MPSRFTAPLGRLSGTARTVLLATVLLVFAVAAMTAFEIWRQRTAILKTAEAQLTSISIALAEQTGRIFGAVDAVVRHTAEEAGAREAARPAQEELFDHSVGMPFVLELLVTDAAGLVVSGNPPPKGPPASLAEADFFTAHQQGRIGTHVGKPAWSAAAQRWMIPVSHRVEDHAERFTGIVVAMVDATYLQEIFGNVVAAEGGTVSIYHSDATLLTRFPHTEDAVGQSFAHLDLFRRYLPAAARGTFRVGRSLDGQPRMIAYAAPPGQQLVLTATLDETILLDPWRANTVRLLLGMVLAVMALAAAATMLLRQIEGTAAQAAALKASQERLRFAQFAIDHAADMVVWVDRAGRILYVNQAACWYFGWPSEDPPSPPLTEVDTAVEREGWEAWLAAIRQSGYVRYESQHRTRAGDLFATEVSANFVAFEGEEYVCCFVRDTRERKEAEALLAEKTARLEASNAELEQFAYVASHDLREPLRMVNSFVAMLGRRYDAVLDDEGREFIHFAQDGATRMDRLILDLLEYSRVGRLGRPQEPMALAGAVELAASALGMLIHETGAVLTVAPGLPRVMGNEEELVRLFLNLLGNALKYRRPDGAPAIAVTATVAGGEVTVAVADNGIGIAPQYFERVFRIFQRLHGREQYDGTGIGLAICKKIVEHHGGRIWVDSEPDKGSTFYFTLKAAE